MNPTPEEIATIRALWQEEYGFTAPDEFIRRHLEYTDTLASLDAKVGVQRVELNTALSHLANLDAKVDVLLVELYTALSHEVVADDLVVRVLRSLGILDALAEVVEDRRSSRVLNTLERV